MRRWRKSDGGERGTVTAFVASFTVALLAVGGLVIDGGLTLATQRRAFNEANAAARAGAQAVDESSLRSAGGLRLDPGQARRRALEHLASTGLTGSADVRGDVVTVEVSTTQRLTVLSLVGVGPLTVHADGSARAVQGVESGDD